MIIYKISLSYNGFGFEGWQVQPSPRKTIQGELNKTLKKIFKSEEIHTLGSGRTDAGVHALEQIVKVSAPFSIPSDALVKALNSGLPKSIRVLSANLCEDFHPTRDALEKTYIYLFYKGIQLPPFLEGRATLIKDDLDWQSMREAANVFIGEHDFVNFSTKGTPVHTTVRSIREITFQTGECPLRDLSLKSDNIELISFTGSGFLKQMVRLLIGTLIEVGKGRVVPRDIDKYLTSGPMEDKLAPVAPPDGLYLKKVVY